MGGCLKAGREGSSVPKLIHSVFPCLIHMLFAHNTSRLRTILALELLVLPPLSCCLFVSVIGRLSVSPAKPVALKVVSLETRRRRGRRENPTFIHPRIELLCIPEATPRGNTSHLPASSNVFKRSGMFGLMRLLLSGWHDQSPERIHQSPVVFITLDGSGENWHDCEFVLVKCWVIKSQRAVNKQIHSATLRHTNKLRRSIAHNGLW